MANLGYLSCCGIQEIQYISETRGVTPQNVLKKLDYPGCGAFIFSEAASGKYATKLAAYVEKHKLGNITVVNEFINPNTGHTIRAFVWTFDPDIVDKHVRHLRKSRRNRNPWRRLT